MRASLFVIFIGITRVLSRDTRVLEAFQVDFDRESSRGAYSELESSKSTVQKNALELLNIFKRELLDNSYLDGLDHKFVSRSFMSFLGPDLNKKHCKDLSKAYCHLLETTKDKEKIYEKMHSLCSREDAVCGDIFKYLKEICENVKKDHDKIDDFTKEICEKELGRCCDLENSCMDILKQSCTKIREECRKLNGTDGSHTEVPAKADFTITHTVVTTVTVVVTEIAPNTNTHTMTLVKTRTCCMRRPTKTALPSECPTTVPATTQDEEEEPTTQDEEKEPTSTEEETTQEESTSTEEESATTQEESTATEEEPETTQDEEGESETGEECSITETVTVTVAPTDERNNANGKSHGIRENGLQKVGLICAIIGMTVGIWVIV